MGFIRGNRYEILNDNTVAEFCAIGVTMDHLRIIERALEDYTARPDLTFAQRMEAGKLAQTLSDFERSDYERIDSFKEARI